eukprot:604473-Pyramimonas_sp.AAC.1
MWVVDALKLCTRSLCTVLAIGAMRNKPLVKWGFRVLLCRRMRRPDATVRRGANWRGVPGGGDVRQRGGGVAESGAGAA